MQATSGIELMKATYEFKIPAPISISRDGKPSWPPIVAAKTETSPVRLEEAYQEIGQWKGLQTPRDRRLASKSFWAAAGDKGIRWLVARLRQERNIEVLHGAASLLAGQGPAIVAPILDELDMPGVGDNGIALFGALGKLQSQDCQPHAVRLRATLQHYLNNRLLELREAAAAATSILPAEQAVALLREALSNETHLVVRETLQDAIADREEEQD